MNRIVYTLGFAIALLLFACTQKEEIIDFDDYEVNQDTVELEITDPEPTSIAGIYANVFKPTCSNVGCHDGTFEPDFRTLESSFNTLLFQEPIKNDGKYSYRVHPYQPDSSVIMARLNNWLSPLMPIQLEPDSDWPEKQEQYIDNIRTWIANGAPDIAGNIRTKQYPAPVLLGAGAMIDGEWLKRVGGTGPIAMPDSTESAELYFSFDHEQMAAEDLQFNQIAYSDNPNNFDSVTTYSLEILPSPIVQRGFYGENVNYTHRVGINPADNFDPAQEQWYFRVYVQDDRNPVTEIPTNEGIYYVKSYMSFRWVE
jgi:hypothetical protein